MNVRSLCAAAMMIIAMACTKAPAATPPKTTTQAEVSGPRVIFPDGFAVQVEIASDDATRAQGLMFRDHVRPGTGMIFLFPQDGNYPFWMKNTLVPLDMIWIDQQKRIAAVKHDVPPCQADPCASYDPQAVARYVLEVAAGVAKQHRLEKGATLRFEGLDNVVIR